MIVGGSRVMKMMTIDDVVVVGEVRPRVALLLVIVAA